MTMVSLRIEPFSGMQTAFISLERPGRSNSLVPELIEELATAVETAARSSVAALVLEGRGRAFSSGGDIAAFDEARDIRDYADRLVGGLQALVLALLRFPAPVLARLQGCVTGGATGLVLAADLVVMAENAFIQPYYVDVGFAPDGGWTALLPEKIGPARALSMQMLNDRLGSRQALDLGLVNAIRPEGELDQQIEAWLALLATKSQATLAVTRRLVWDERRLADIEARLAAEHQAFLALIETPETRTGMKRFLT